MTCFDWLSVAGMICANPPATQGLTPKEAGGILYIYTLGKIDEIQPSRVEHDDIVEGKHFRVSGPVTRSFDNVFDMRRNKRLSKQSRRRCHAHCDVAVMNRTKWYRGNRSLRGPFWRV